MLAIRDRVNHDCFFFNVFFFVFLLFGSPIPNLHTCFVVCGGLSALPIHIRPIRDGVSRTAEAHAHQIHTLMASSFFLSFFLCRQSARDVPTACRNAARG